MPRIFFKTLSNIYDMQTFKQWIENDLSRRGMLAGLGGMAFSTLMPQIAQAKDLIGTPHFKPTEFDCPHCGGNLTKQALLNALEKFRTYIGDKPIKITSGYRCPVHNKNVGGAKNSQHVQGIAADIQVSGLPLNVVYTAADKFGFGGVGIYPRHVHVDIRNGHARWKGTYKN